MTLSVQTIIKEARLPVGHGTARPNHEIEKRMTINQVLIEKLCIGIECFSYDLEKSLFHY